MDYGMWIVISVLGGISIGLLLAWYLRLHHTIDELEKTTTTLNAVVETAVDAIITIDETGHIQSVNQAALSMFGYAEDKLVGNNVRMLMPDPHFSNHDEYINNYLQSGVRKIIGIGREVTCKRSDNSVFPADLSVSEISGGGAIRFAGILRDRSEHHRQMDELNQQQKSLAHAARLATMGEMSAGLAHEINQPLAAIATYAQAARRLMASTTFELDDLKHALVQMEEQAHRAGDVMRRMRVLAKGGQIERSFIDVAELVEDLSTLIDIDAHHKQTAIEYDLASCNCRVFADKVQIQQVLLNFVRNGIDSMQDTPIDQRRIIIGCELCNEGAKVSVRDFGKGVSKNDENSLFHPFFTTKESGMGMGLSISKSIISGHNGKIGHTRPEGDGAIFWFILKSDIKEKN